MTDDLERLEALAREILGSPNSTESAVVFDGAEYPHSGLWVAIKAQTMLSLIQRVREADAEIARLNKPIKIYVGSSYVDDAAIRALGEKAG